MQQCCNSDISPSTIRRITSRVSDTNIVLKRLIFRAFVKYFNRPFLQHIPPRFMRFKCRRDDKPEHGAHIGIRLVTNFEINASSARFSWNQSPATNRNESEKRARKSTDRAKIKE